MLIKYLNGIVQEAMLVSVRGSQLRAAPKDSDDLLEFNLVEGIWISENCEPVTFDFTLGLLETIGFSRTKQPETLPSSKSCDYVN